MQENLCREEMALADASSPEAGGCDELRQWQQRRPQQVDRRSLLRGAGMLAAGAVAAAVLEPTELLAASPEQETPIPAMRRAALDAPDPRAGAPSQPPLALIALNRMGFGPRPGDVAAFNALGNNDDARLTAYVDQQLNPQSIDDAECDAILASFEFETLGKSLTKLWEDHDRQSGVDWRYRRLPVWETERATFVKGLHSKRQLTEALADFWHNHFNVYGWDGWQRTTFVHYDRDVIRGNMLGNFRQMLGDVAKSPAMLYYLDNRQNQGGNPNENYARELFELHTLGAENYMGVRSSISEQGIYEHPAPKDDQNWPLLYVDDDVYGATTCFTGWTIDNQTGQFRFDASRHFPYQKLVLGRTIPPQQGLRDGEITLDILANHRGTATYIARKLCRRLISDSPPESVVQIAAQVFHDNRDAPDQLKKVVRTILLSPEFRAAWGQKIKRPLEFALSIMRATGCNYDARSDSFFWWYNAMGQPLFAWHPPDGYPDTRTPWTGTMTTLQRWRFVNDLLGWKIGGDGEDKNDLRVDLVGVLPANVTTPNAIVDFWAERLMGRRLPDHERQEVAEFLAQGRAVESDLRPDQISARLYPTVALLLMTPSFQWR